MDLGTSSQIIIFRERYSLNFRPILNCLEQAISSKSRQNSEMKTRKVTKYIYSFRNI